jgi:hypothetical protein
MVKPKKTLWVPLWLQHDKPLELISYVGRIPEVELADAEARGLPELRLSSSYSGDVLWRPNYIFKDSLRITGYGKGRSAVRIYLESNTDLTKYETGLATLIDWIQKNRMVGDSAEGSFTFAKRGANYKIVGA